MSRYVTLQQSPLYSLAPAGSSMHRDTAEDRRSLAGSVTLQYTYGKGDSMPTPRQHANNAAKQKAYRGRAALERLREQRVKGLPTTPPIPTIPADRRWDAMLQQALAIVEMAKDEMDGYYTDRSETWQDGERGEALQARMEAIDEIVNNLNDVTTF